MSNNLRNIPKIDELSSDERISFYKEQIHASRLTEILRQSTEYFREMLQKNEFKQATRDQLKEFIILMALGKIEEYFAEKLKKVINATGVVVHTNLGRAPLSDEVIADMLEIASGYNNLEYSTVLGERRGRLSFIENMIKDLTGAEACLVVNNNASAVYLALNAVAYEKETLLSRGEIVEIGDSFRVSEIMRLSGAIIKEIGTTNKTKLDDYEKHINENTGLILKVHTSNYKIIGFTEEVTSKQLTALGNKHNIPVMEDMGSGILFDLKKIGFSSQRQVKDAVSDGVDIITISGDKMLGGPQAGIILGKKKYIDLMKKNQMLRCLRVDKLCLIALESTLRQYYKKDFYDHIKILKYLKMPKEQLFEQSEYLKNEILNVCDKITAEVKEHTEQYGGGSLPNEIIEGYAIFITGKNISITKLDKHLRSQVIPIITAKHNDELIICLRTVEIKDYKYIINAFSNL